MTFSAAHVLVTGAAGAIGRALCRAMRATWPEVRFALVDRDTPALERLRDELPRSHAHAADLRDVEALSDLYAAIEHAGGPVDGLVNCAGIMRVETLASFAWEEARDLVAVDLLAPLRLQDLFAKGALARGGGGFVVNVSSMAGRIPLKGCAYYGAAKAGLAMASEVARVELAAHGIRVVTVCPGPVRSPLEEAARAGYGGGGAVGELLPLGSPEGLAACVVDAVLANRAHVVYPRAYAAGLMAPALSSWAVNALAPDPARGIRSPPARR